MLGQARDGGQLRDVVVGVDDLRRHVYIAGQTGTGKSTLLKNVAAQAIQLGRGIAVLDPHGDTVDAVLDLIPPERADDLIYLNPSDKQWAVGFNFMECDEPDRQMVVESFLGVLYELFDPHRQGIVGPRFEHAVRNAMHLAMSSPHGATLVDVVRVLTEPSYARWLLPYVEDPMVRNYWEQQIPATSDFHRSEVLDYIVSKFSRFTHDARIRRVLCQQRSTFSMREAMDQRKILLINLSQGLLGAETSRFLGMLVVNRLLEAAFSRADVPLDQRADFLVLVDEFQDYASPAFKTMLSGARKYRLSLVMAHQHVAQLPAELRDAVFGNVGTMVSFRVGVKDAPLLMAAMEPSPLVPADYLSLPNFTALATTLSDGERVSALSLAMSPDPLVPGTTDRWAQTLVTNSNKRYGRRVDDIDRAVQAQFGGENSETDTPPVRRKR